MASRGRGRYRRGIISKATKRAADGFYKWLESKGLRQDMTKQALRMRYDEYNNSMKMEVSEYKNAVRFPDVLEAWETQDRMQHLRGNILFGTAEELMTKLLTESKVPTFTPECASRPNYCRLCDVSTTSLLSYNEHVNGGKHKRRQMLDFMTQYDIDQMSGETEGIKIFQDDKVDTETITETVIRNRKKDMYIYIENCSGTNTVTLREATFVFKNVFLQSEEFNKISKGTGTSLRQGSRLKLKVRISGNAYYGRIFNAVLFSFEKIIDGEPSDFYILTRLCIDVISEFHDDLKKTKEYIPPIKRIPFDETGDKVILRGDPLPPINKNGLQMKALPDFKIPDRIKSLMYTDSSKDIRKTLQKNSVLSFSNYKSKFSDLLYTEEVQMCIDIRNYDLEDVTFTKQKRDQGLLTLQVPGLAEKRPSVLRGDRIFAYDADARKKYDRAEFVLNSRPLPRGGTRYEGIVHTVEQLDLKISFHKRMPFLPGKKFDVQFTFTRMPLKLQHQAVCSVSERKELAHVISPTQESTSLLAETSKIQLRPWYDRKLNQEQQLAVTNIVNGTSKPAPFLVFGPPGTGKTITVVESVKQIFHCLHYSVILACAPENSAADLIVERLLDSIPAAHLFRMYAASRPYATVPTKLKEAKVTNFDSYGEIFYPPLDEIKKKRVIVTTLITAGRLVASEIGTGHFTHIFIDESGHAVEPECIIPVAGLLDPSQGQLVMAGDPKQLGPILRSHLTKEFKLGTSFLERLMELDLYQKSPEVMTKLLNNYRSHEKIIETSNKLFYESELKACADGFCQSFLNWEELPNKGCPIILHPVYGADEREERSPSFFNVAEIETVELYLRKLLDEGERSKRVKFVKPEHIGIITPYQRQVMKIKQMLKKRFSQLNHKDLKVGSVEEFQGQERSVIILSLVRSREEYLDHDANFQIGFLNNPKRMNVALTRAKALLIVIGNPDMMRTDPNWLTFHEFCGENGAIKTSDDYAKKGSVAKLARRLQSVVITDEDSTVRTGSISQAELEEHLPWNVRE